MNEIFAVAAGISTLALIAFYAFESRAWRAERRDLLNRVMAKNYNEFVYTATTTATETPQMTTDEAEAKWSIDHESADSAWHAENKRQHPELYPDDGVVE